jgi:photosynthetic reaction center cytochrome c subunit
MTTFLKSSSQRWLGLAAGIGASLVLMGCERLPVDVTQGGYRGTGMEQVVNPRTEAMKVAANQAPAALDPADEGGPKASQVYQNVQVLGDLSVAQFNRLMVAMTAWVAPEQGCAYCHNVQNFAEDSLYTKVVARRMTQMTQTVNARWQAHVGQTGVTCYTCHRGKNLPEKRWFTEPEMQLAGRLLGNDASQNRAGVEAVANSSLPYDPYTPFLLDKSPIRVNGTTALPTGNRMSIKQTEWTYALMMHMSEGLGVNCTHCHNTRAFSNWEQSPPARVTAWYGIRMVRELNNEFIVGLTSIQPPNRLGVTGDISKVNCATCHQGVNKPLYGAQMLKAHPELSGPNALKDAMEINAPPVPAAPSKTSGAPAAADMKQSAVVLPTRVN